MKMKTKKKYTNELILKILMKKETNEFILYCRGKSVFFYLSYHNKVIIIMKLMNWFLIAQGQVDAGVRRLRAVGEGRVRPGALRRPCLRGVCAPGV